MTTVQLLADNGFVVGGSPADPCAACPHRWGQHVLIAAGDPLDGGAFHCPECFCAGTWNIADDLKE
jgi:hypothetical protein